MIAAALLRERGISSVVAKSLSDFGSRLGDDILLAVVVEEAFRSGNIAPINAWVKHQPSWSDLPFIVLAHRGAGPERNPAAARLAEALGSVSFLERPFHPTTFVSVIETAQKNRRRQYEARNRMVELHESELSLKTALLAGHLGTWQIELDGWSLTSSPEFRRIFGRAADAGLTYEELANAVHPDDRARRDALLAETLSTGGDYIAEYRSIWPDNTVHWAEVRGRLVKDAAGYPVRLAGVASDITDRKMAEAHLVSINETLERRVEERTAALRIESAQREAAEAKLRQSQKLEAIGQLTGGVAHDFNNLLMAVLGNLELLRKHVAHDAKALRLVEGALQGAERGASLTQRLLAFARRQDLEVEPVDIAALLSNMLELLVRSVGSAILLTADIDDDLPPVLVDGNQVELALLNLVVNARDAMPGGGAITICLREYKDVQPADHLSEGAFVCLSVSDDGVGMDADTLRRAIDPFFSTKELGKGTGLGLSMIHGLAEQLGGALKLISRPGEGTTAELWLPVTARSPEKSETPAVNTQSIDVGVSILVVDDDALIAMSTVDMLEDLGHSVVEANSGESALKVLSSEARIDLMITDFSMPGMNGAQLAEKARELRPGLPILVATGYADLPEGTGLDLPRLGKPYSQNQLKSEVEKILLDK
ncbi:Blue-light-activated protein [Ensifer adhaerens]|uniref:hybrid sensor histidine kinase/response regulator n=1 Tax=Ensifer adhaerens TaxID=106592 RepID=UPI001568FAEC|nr:hybrid sensor histidine kinase/response regulator [Ensifer adhaerens]NRP21927.1 Blue-light-activated protein [Ensifer adhaerens]